jgi:gluconate 2-dehydrogenase gamma chain
MICVDNDFLSRRDFVGAVGSIGGFWLLSDPAALLAATDHAHQQAAAQTPKLLFLSPAQAREIDAVTSRIIPTDDRPGAHEAGIVYFVDKSLTTFAKEQAPAITEGLKKLADDVSAKYPGQTKFSALTVAQQDELLKSMEQTAFFGTMRFVTIAGMFALPTYGGNRNYAGWKLVGQDLTQDYKPPFGWYDEPKNKRALMQGE